MGKTNLLTNLYKAYYEARRNKRNTNEQLAFEVDHETQLHHLYEAICKKNLQGCALKGICYRKTSISRNFCTTVYR